MNARPLVAGVLLLAVAAVGPLTAQERAAKMLAQARDSIEQGSFEPALGLIDRVLQLRPEPGPPTHLRAHVLRGVTLILIGGRDDEAVGSFHEALLIDPTTRVDSLQSLSNQLLRLFALAEEQVAAEEEARLGDLEIRGLPQSGALLFVDDTLWDEPRQLVTAGWRQIRVTADGYLPFRDSVLVDSGQVVVKNVYLLRPPLTLSIAFPDSTTVAANDAHLAIAVVAGRPAQVLVELKTPQGGTVQTDSQSVGGRGRVLLSLRAADGAIVPTGTYSLTAQAVDSFGVFSTLLERSITISRPRVDTQPMPPAPPASAFLAESVPAHPGPAAPALGSALLAVLTIAAPFVLANRELGPYGARTAMAYTVGGAIGISGLIGFLTGKQIRRSASNTRFNSARRAEYARAVRDAADANARLRAAAPIIVRVLPGGP